METFLIATGCLWVLEFALIAPLARAIAARKRLVPPTTAASAAIDNASYVLVDVIVLAIVGSILGLLGHRFVGISLKAKGWPGMLAFIITSFTFAALQGAVQSL